MKIMEKINYSISSNRPLVCIGYHIPDIRVEKCQFTKPVYFTNAVFHGKLVFNNIIFQHCDFSGARFQDAIFSVVTFLNNVSFFWARFLGRTLFYIIGFQGDAVFNEAQFGEFEFVRITFEKAALFQFARLKEGYFRGTLEFVGKADFSFAQFTDIEFSSKTIFHGTADFTRAVFHKRTIIQVQNFGYFTLFKNVLFEEQDKTIFDVKDLTHVSFLTLMFQE